MNVFFNNASTNATCTFFEANACKVEKKLIAKKQNVLFEKAFTLYF